MAEDFNATRIIDALINNPVRAMETTTNEFATEGDAFGAFATILIIFFVLVILVGLVVGGVYAIFFWKKKNR
jgi:hypothetical protein